MYMCGRDCVRARYVPKNENKFYYGFYTYSIDNYFGSLSTKLLEIHIPFYLLSGPNIF